MPAAWLRGLAAVARLRGVHVWHKSFTVGKLEAVRSLTRLTALSLTHMGEVSDPKMPALTALSALTR